MSPGFRSIRPQLEDEVGVVAVRHEADVLAVGLFGDHQSQLRRKRARLALGQAAERKAQEVGLGLRCCEEEVALVARHVLRRHQIAAAIGAGAALDIMACGQRTCIEIAGVAQKICELDGLVAADTGNGCRALYIRRDEIVDHGFAEARFEIEHVVGNAEGGRDAACIVNVLPGAAGALPPDRLAMIVKLQGDAHDVISRRLQQGCCHGRIDAARHGAHHPVPRRVARQCHGPVDEGQNLR